MALGDVAAGCGPEPGAGPGWAEDAGRRLERGERTGRIFRGNGQRAAQLALRAA